MNQPIMSHISNATVILIGAVLALVPVGSQAFIKFEPIVLVISFLSLKKDSQLSLGVFVFLGLLLDVLLLRASIIQSALGYLLCCYFCLRFEIKRQYFSIWQEALFIALLTVQCGLISALFEASYLGKVIWFEMFSTSLGNFLIWIILSYCIDMQKRR